MTNYTATLIQGNISGIPLAPPTPIKEVITMPLWLFIPLALTAFALIALMLYEALITPNRRLAYMQAAFSVLLISLSVAYNIMLGYVAALGFAFAGAINAIKASK